MKAIHQVVSYFGTRHVYNQGEIDGLHCDNVQKVAFIGLWGLPFLGLGTLGSG